MCLLCEYITDNNIDILAITEPWLKDGDVVSDLLPSNYKLLSVPRPSAKGGRRGGVGYVIRANIDCVVLPQAENKTFESHTIRLNG